MGAAGIGPAERAFSDIRKDSWLERALPSAGPYIRLARMDRPIGSWLLFWPCAWGTALAAQPGGPPDVALLGLFAVGAVAMRGAGCTINDMWDRDIDRRVERTRTRPLAAGELSMPQAYAFLLAQLLAGLAVAVQLEPVALGVALASMPLVVAYPLAKRFTGWPQAVLGLAMNWGVLVGWAGARGAVDPLAVLPAYAGAWCWTMYYDTIYAYQDARDDEGAGVLSSARSLGDGLAARASLAWFALCAAAGVAAAGCAGLEPPLPPAFGLAVGAGAGLLVVQAATLPMGDRAACLAAFKRSHLFGLWVSASIVGFKLAQGPASASARKDGDVGSRPGSGPAGEQQSGVHTGPL